MTSLRSTIIALFIIHIRNNNIRCSRVSRQLYWQVLFDTSFEYCQYYYMNNEFPSCKQNFIVFSENLTIIFDKNSDGDFLS